MPPPQTGAAFLCVALIVDLHAQHWRRGRFGDGVQLARGTSQRIENVARDLVVALADAAAQQCQAVCSDDVQQLLTIGRTLLPQKHHCLC
ncbi:MAG: hypothetical protein ACK55Z_21095 [bacterium]